MAPQVKQEYVDVEELADEMIADALGTTTVRSENSQRRASFHQQLSEYDSDNGLEIMGRGVKELVQAVQKLRHLGIEDLGLPLPKIVVVGDQSTGKSSLIEGMSEIKVPRNVGTCTRCPLEINLTENRTGDPWKCEVSLFQKYTYERAFPRGNNRTGIEAATRARPLGASWAPQDGETIPFATISSKDQVASVLKGAQLATLNPSSGYDKYLPGKVDPGNNLEVKFSPNVVRMDISGPGLPNMSFYDLPGVISQPEVPEEQYLVDLVKNLVKEYIKDDSCINLLALPMTDDPTNSTASSLVRKVNAQSRTVGVLTKPDRQQQGESQLQWLEILKGQRFELGFGYFVIKNNPDPAVEYATARAEEREYFQKEEPSAADWNRYSDRFGTLKLQTFLSKKLTAQILKSLPRVTEQVRLKSTAIEEELRTLPEPPEGNLPMLILQCLNDFESNIKKLIDGDIPIIYNGENQDFFFWKEWNSLAITFREIMAESRPVLMMSDSTDSVGMHTQTQPRHPETIDLDEELSDTGIASQSGQKRRYTYDTTPSKRRLTEIPFVSPEKNAGSDRRYAVRFRLWQIRDIIREGVPGLVGQIDTRTVDRVIRLSLAKWDQPLDQFLQQVEKLCCDMFMKQIDQIFGRWRATGLYTQVVRICSSFLKDAMAAQRAAAKRALQLELHKPASFDAEGLRIAEEKAIREIEANRHNYRAWVFVTQQEQRNVKGGSGLSREDKVAKVSGSQLGSDPYSQEVRLIGSVRGYYECAFSRFVDVVCQGVQGELFLSCRNDIGHMIKESIGILKAGADERCSELLAVEKNSLERRLQLMKEKAVINEAHEWLEGLVEDGTSEKIS